MSWGIAIVLWIIFGFIGYLIGNPKNRPVLGFVLGFCLGIIGIIIMICLRPKINIQPPADEQPPTTGV